MLNVVAIFTLSRVLYGIFSITASWIIPFIATFTLSGTSLAHAPYPFWIMGNFDGLHYLRIAEYGYRAIDYPFFPLFPLTIATIHRITGLNYLYSGLIISNGAFFGSMLLFRQLLKIDHISHRRLFFLIVILFPTAFYYSAVYNDSLFLFFASAALYAGRRKNWVLSSLAASCATLTRLNGLTLFFFIAAEYLNIHPLYRMRDLRDAIIHTIAELTRTRHIIRNGIITIILIPIVFVLYLAYIQHATGDWHMLFTGMKTWQQDHAVFPPQVFWRYFKILALHPQMQVTYFVAATELLFVIGYIAVLVYAYSRIRLSYWVFFALSILIPSLTGTFQGMPRYGLHIYPFFLCLTLFLSKRSIPWRIAYFAISGILLYIFIGMFTRGYFIA